MMTILYVDDDHEDQEIFKEAIQTIAPHSTCYFAKDGQDAFRLLNKIILAPDYIFLDINMPEMNGKEFLARLKETKGFKATPVIIFSTSSSEVDINECKKLGAVDFITKSGNFRGICESLKRYI